MKRSVPLCLTLLLGCAGAFALTVPDRPSSRVNDYAQMLSPQTRSDLDAELAAFEQKTSNQIVVVTFESLEGESLEDFSVRLAQKWGIGTKEHDNGVVLIIFKKDREIRIEVGYGLEGALPDALAKRIIEKELVPSFRVGAFDQGVTNGIRAIMAATQGEYKAAPVKEDSFETLAPVGLALLILYMLLPYICYGAIVLFSFAVNGVIGAAIALAVVAALELIRRTLLSGLVSHTYSSGGGGGWSSGGGFSGGGFSVVGGSFGGGGASGRW